MNEEWKDTKYCTISTKDYLVPWNEYNPYKVTPYGGECWEPTMVGCPKCGERLEIRTDIVLTSYPPQHQFRCTKCDWRGTK